MFTVSLKKGHGIGLYVLIAVLLTIPIFLYSGIQNSKKIIPVPYIGQNGTLYSGCELASATMVLHYYHCMVGIDDFAAQVPTSKLTKTEKGYVGEDPSQAFIGDPYSKEGLGCYAPVISAAMNSCFTQSANLHAQALNGTDFEVLLKEYTAQGIPVILWATKDMEEPDAGPCWTIKETGESFQWIAGEHCLVLVGYDDRSCYFNDPSDPSGVVSFDRTVTEKRYNNLGRQAVVVCK